MRHIILALAAAAAIAVPFTMTATASASPRLDAWHDWLDNGNNSQFGCPIDSKGSGLQFVLNLNNCTPAGGTDFQLINKNISGGYTEYEIAYNDPNTNDFVCMNASDNTGVYANSCNFGQSTEEWISTGATHYWENVHRGTNGYLNVDCNIPGVDCPATIVSVNPSLPWATPDS